MKVLHLNTIDVGGAAIGSIRQHYALKDAGIDSRILFMRNINAHVKGSYYYLGKISYYYYRLLQKVG